MKLLLYNLRASLVYLCNLLFRQGVYSSNVSLLTKLGKNTVVNMYSNIDSQTSIGNYTYIGKNTSITKTTIGNYCSIADGVYIGQGEHDLSKISTSVQFYQNAFNELTKNKCIIENDVWIGANVCIKRGVKISNGAVIGAGAVITKDVPPFAIVVGVPGKIIRFRFNEKKIKLIVNSNWWNYDKKNARKIIKKINEK